MSDHPATAEPAHDTHGHAGHEHSVTPYLMVGAALFVFTAITVALSYIKFENIRFFTWAFSKIGVHGFTINIVIGMIVATFKVCLVGAWFMHLKDEKATIWRPLLFTFFFVTGLFLLFALAYADPIFSTSQALH